MTRAPNKPINTDEAVETLLRGYPLAGSFLSDSDEIKKYEIYQEKLKHKYLLFDAEDADVVCNHDILTDIWYVPEKYQKLDLKKFILDKCNTAEEKKRTQEELDMFYERDLEQLLRLLIFLVDHMTERGILWGVGRGSSVSSYVLYLIGVHQIDSLKYNLDIKEFLK